MGVRFPWLLPMIKGLIKIPPNIIFDHIYSLSQAWEWRKWENVSFLRFAQEIIKNYPDSMASLNAQLDIAIINENRRKKIELINEIDDRLAQYNVSQSGFYREMAALQSENSLVNQIKEKEEEYI